MSAFFDDFSRGICPISGKGCTWRVFYRLTKDNVRVRDESKPDMRMCVPAMGLGGECPITEAVRALANGIKKAD